MGQTEIPDDKTAGRVARDDTGPVRSTGEDTLAAGEIDEMRHLFAVMTGKAILSEQRLDVCFVAYRAGERFLYRRALSTGGPEGAVSGPSSETCRQALMRTRDVKSETSAVERSMTRA